LFSVFYYVKYVNLVMRFDCVSNVNNYVICYYVCNIRDIGIKNKKKCIKIKNYFIN